MLDVKVHENVIHVDFHDHTCASTFLLMKVDGNCSKTVSLICALYGSSKKYVLCMLQQLEKKLTELLNFTPYTYIQKTYNNVLCSIKKISESTSF